MLRVHKQFYEKLLMFFISHIFPQYYEARDMSPEEMQKVIDRCSKHRAKYQARPSTPEGLSISVIKILKNQIKINSRQ